uniref:Uncharacterized protein n=1 Tax=Oryza punctata TaxID=4537 RepID=A0A0E0JEF3_ORYPU
MWCGVVDTINGSMLSCRVMAGMVEWGRACYVRLRASPDFECNNPTNINYSSIEGAPLRDEGKRWADHDYDNVMRPSPSSVRFYSILPTPNNVNRGGGESESEY